MNALLTTLALVTALSVAPLVQAKPASAIPKAPMGSIVLPSLSYTVLHAGPLDGVSPKRADTVTVNYEVKLLDGTVVDSSFTRGEPAEFPLKALIPAWQVIVPMMRPGDEWRVVVPPQFAYGAVAKENIPANSTLIFRIVLLSVKPAS